MEAILSRGKMSLLNRNTINETQAFVSFTINEINYLIGQVL